MQFIQPSIEIAYNFLSCLSSVVDLLAVLLIRIWSDPKLLARSGSGKNHSGSGLIRNELEAKLFGETDEV
jgi:hypothetical protein